MDSNKGRTSKSCSQRADGVIANGALSDESSDGSEQPPTPPSSDGSEQPPTPPSSDGLEQPPAPPVSDGLEQPPTPPSPNKPPSPPSVYGPPQPSRPGPQPQPSQSPANVTRPVVNPVTPPSPSRPGPKPQPSQSPASVTPPVVNPVTPPSPSRPGPPPQPSQSPPVVNPVTPPSPVEPSSPSPTENPSLVLDFSCTAPDPGASVAEDCSIQEGQKVVAVLNDLRVQRGLPPFETSAALQAAVRLELLTLVGCDVCNERSDSCIKNCGSKPSKQRPFCRDTCVEEFDLCRETECSPLTFLDCCSCSNPARPSVGRQLQRRPSPASCSRVESRLPSSSAQRTAHDISNNRSVFERRNRCAACATARTRNQTLDGWDFVTLCRICRKC
ncbi:hypothetical protein CBR_g28008 [Chara braunii]|uniref:Uncharacterized protein n=1 Tax=Chara braunii TaxID=69332 RepID=A0A388L919_CHABU|nr:hypothetical protein CBR_g28008 [Chara braunii]|eukprot:GBG78784.1 hypothetical protein CBR_g28008 [Chara braunii]